MLDIISTDFPASGKHCRAMKLGPGLLRLMFASNKHTWVEIKKTFTTINH